MLKCRRKCPLLRCCLLLLIFSCVDADAGFVTDRKQLHNGSLWTYKYFLGGGYYFNYEFHFSVSYFPSRGTHYHINRTISLYHVPEHSVRDTENGQVRLPSGHTITREEYWRKLYKKEYKIKPGGLLAEIFNAGVSSDVSRLNAASPMAISEESYNLDLNYVVLDFHIQVSLPDAQFPLRHWHGVNTGTTMDEIFALPGRTRENTSVQKVLPNTYLVLGLPTLLHNEPSTHSLQLTLYEATDNLYGYMQLQRYTPQRYGNRACVQLTLNSYELEQKGGGSIVIMINTNGIIRGVKVYYNQPKPGLPAIKYPPHFRDKRDDDHWPPPGGASGMGGGFYGASLPVNLLEPLPAYEWMLINIRKKLDFLLPHNF